MRETIEPNAGNKIEQIARENVDARETIEQIASKKKEIERNKTAFKPHFKYSLDNIQISSLTTTFGRNTDKHISISTTNQSDDTNCTRTENILLLTETVESKYLTIGNERLGEKLIAESNQVIAYIDIRIHGEQ